MNTLAAVVFCVAVAAASAGGIGLVGPAAPGAVLHAPSAHAALVGPDGSHIAAAAPGGAVIAGPRHGGHVSAAVVPGHVAIGHAGLGVGLGAVLAGPAGVVGPVGVVGPWGGVAHGVHGAWLGSGHEGQWIPDHNELLYDDGSYKPHWYH